MADELNIPVRPAELIGTGEIIRKDGTVVPIVIHGRVVAPQPEEKEQDNG
jgi:hypothetical protein